MRPTILLIGTADTKSDELLYLRERIEAAGAQVVLMDVGVLAPGHPPPAISNQAVAAARLGAAVAFVGAVGGDPFGQELRAGLVAEGIEAVGLQEVDF